MDCSGCSKFMKVDVHETSANDNYLEEVDYVQQRHGGGTELSKPLETSSEIADIEIEHLEFFLLDFHLAFLQYFHSIPPFIPTEIIMCVRC